MPDSKTLQNPIARRLILYIVLFSTVITILITAFQLYRDYLSDLELIERDFDQIENVHLDSLSSALWAANRRLLQTSLNGIGKIRDIQYVEVRDEQRVWAKSGAINGDNFIQRKYLMNYRHRNKNINIGSLIVNVSLDGVYQRIINKVWVILVTNGVKTSFVAFFIYFIFYQLVARHLIAISDFSKKHDPLSNNSRLSLNRTSKKIDEFDIVVQSINNMHGRLHLQISEIDNQKQYLAQTLDSIGDAVITTDISGNVVRLNPVAEALTGWSNEVALQQPLKTIFPIINASTREIIPNPVDKVLKTGEIVYLSNHTTLISKDGTEYQIADSAAPIRDSSGKILGMVLVFNDVSEQYRLREEIKSKQLLIQGLIDDLKSMVGVMQPDGRILFINNMPLELAAVKKDLIIGELLWKCCWFDSEPGISQKIKSMCKEAGEGTTVTYDVKFNALNHSLWMELGVYPVLDEKGKLVQMVFEGADISHRKEAEALQINYQLTLEKQVQERTAELEHKAQELVRATELKTEFLAKMSHELRTPMNSIIGFTKRVLKKSAEQLDERQLNNLQTVDRNAHHLLELINGLLDLSKIEAGKMEAHAETFSFTQLAVEVFELAHAMLEKKSIELSLNIPESDIQLYTDVTKLKQILINLVSNSIKFTHSGKITIAAHKKTLPDEEEQIVIQVSDTGIGIAQDALAFIFEAFRQANEKLSQKVGGTGLGLAIVSNYVELLRGSVIVTSEIDIGTTFEICIPVDL